MEKRSDGLVNACVVDMSEEFRKELLQIVHSRKPGPPPKTSRRGFTRHQISKWFAVSETEVYRWDTCAVRPPHGYSEALRQSGNFDQLSTVLQTYWDLKRSKGGDAYSSGHLVHVDDPAFLMR